MGVCLTSCPLVLLPYSHVPWRLKCLASQKKNCGDHINDELSLFTSSSSDVLPPLGCKLSCAMFEDLKHNDGNMSAYGFDVKNTISHKNLSFYVQNTQKSNTNFFLKIIILCLVLLWDSLDSITILSSE
jgi:hypothetical protein